MGGGRKELLKYLEKLEVLLSIFPMEKVSFTIPGDVNDTGIDDVIVE